MKAERSYETKNNDKNEVEKLLSVELRTNVQYRRERERERERDEEKEGEGKAEDCKEEL